MTGTDGRIYDSHYDYDHDGKLNMFERMQFEESLDLHKDYPISKRQNPFTLLFNCGGLRGLIGLSVWCVGFLTMVIVPPLGALIILAAIKITDK